MLNRILIRPILKKTPYELFKERKPNISHLRVFSCKCFILNNGKDNSAKFDSQADEGIFLGYSPHSHTYRAYNKSTMLIEETVHITFDEINQKLQEVPKFTADDGEIESIQRLNGTTTDQEIEQPEESKSRNSEIYSAPDRTDLPQEWRVPRDLSLDNVIGQIHKGISTRKSLNRLCENMAFVSQTKPKTIQEALSDDHWISSMQEELNQFTRNDVWSLVPRTSKINVMGIKWVFKNKIDE